jgi:uncharacterized membrane protein YsdA (DUF1294 family)
MEHQGTRPYIFYGCFSLGVAALTFYLMWNEVGLSMGKSALLGVNAAGLIGMGLDKSLSSSSSMRYPEVVLYLVALLGGVPGILVGMHVFKHKSRKPAFQFALLLILVAQVVTLRAVVSQ